MECTVGAESWAAEVELRATGSRRLVLEREKRATLGFARFYYLFCCLGYLAEGGQPAEGNNPAACGDVADCPC